MTRPLPVDLLPAHRRLVLDILWAHLPQHTKTWVFGSRATGRARRYSDLDLAIDAGRRPTLDEIAELAEAFSDSDLPYKSIWSIGTISTIVGGRRSPPNARLGQRLVAPTPPDSPASRLPITDCALQRDRDQAAGFSCTSIAIE
jgi:hypothetical protein